MLALSVSGNNYLAILDFVRNIILFRKVFFQSVGWLVRDENAATRSAEGLCRAEIIGEASIRHNRSITSLIELKRVFFYAIRAFQHDQVLFARNQLA